MTLLLILGIILGIRHALEPDHLVTVLALSAHSKSLSATAKQGVMWGLGHTITLLIFSLIILGLQINISDAFFIYIEAVCGLIIFAMGFEVLLRTKIYNSQKNIKDINKNPKMIKTYKSPIFSLRALGIGLLHGVAGSGVIIALVTATLDSIYLKFTYITLFSIGLIVTMGLFSLLLSVPFNCKAKIFSSQYLSYAAGLLGILIGLKIIYNFIIQINTMLI